MELVICNILCMIIGALFLNIHVVNIMNNIFIKKMGYGMLTDNIRVSALVSVSSLVMVNLPDLG